MHSCFLFGNVFLFSVWMSWITDFIEILSNFRERIGLNHVLLPSNLDAIPTVEVVQQESGISRNVEELGTTTCCIPGSSLNQGAIDTLSANTGVSLYFSYNFIQIIQTLSAFSFYAVREDGT